MVKLYTPAIEILTSHDIFTKMSLASHEEIGHVGCVGRGCYEDPREDVTRMLREKNTTFVEFKINRTRNLSIHIDLRTHAGSANRLTLTFDLKVSAACLSCHRIHHEFQVVRVEIAQVVFRAQTETHILSRRRH